MIRDLPADLVERCARAAHGIISWSSVKKTSAVLREAGVAEMARDRDEAIRQHRQTLKNYRDCAAHAAAMAAALEKIRAHNSGSWEAHLARAALSRYRKGEK